MNGTKIGDSYDVVAYKHYRDEPVQKAVTKVKVGPN